MCVTSVKIVVGLALLCAASGFPSAEPPKSDSAYRNDASDLVGTSGTGQNWLSPYVRLLFAVIPSSDTIGLPSVGAQSESKSAGSNDNASNLRLNPRSVGYVQPFQPLQPTQLVSQSLQSSRYPSQTVRPATQPSQLQQAMRPTQRPQQPLQQQQPAPPKPLRPTSLPPQSYTSRRPNRPAPLHSQHSTSFVPLKPIGCSNANIKHKGTFTPLVQPTTGNIYKNKSEGDPEAIAALASARAAVAARTVATASPRPGTGTAQRKSGNLLSVSNPKTRSRPNLVEGVPRQLDVCSSVWRQETPPQRTETDQLDLFAFFSTLDVPEPATTPMTPPVTEASVAETCTLPPPYMDDRYDWLEVLAAHGGLPGCVNATQRPEQPKVPPRVSDTCERPLNESFAGEELYTYMLSDLRTFYRDERAYLRFPGESKQFVDVRGLLVWTSPMDDGNVYVVEYIVDDTGLWIDIPETTCKFVDTMTLTCTTRLKCWCQDDKQTCLAQHGLPGNLYAALVGGG